MKVVLLIFGMIVACGMSLAVDPGQTQFGLLRLEFPVGWRFKSTPTGSEGDGRGGEHLIASSVVAQAADQKSIDHLGEVTRAFARDQMPALASKNGNVIREVSERPLDDGRVQYSGVSQGKRMLRDYYFIQYLLRSRRSMVYMTVEGLGSAVAEADAMDKILASQTWQD